MCQHLLSEIVSALAAHFIACTMCPLRLWIQEAPREFHHVWKPQPHWQDDLVSPGPLYDSQSSQWHMPWVSFILGAPSASPGPSVGGHSNPEASVMTGLMVGIQVEPGTLRSRQSLPLQEG